MKKITLLPEMKTAPAVFAVKDCYQITVPVKSDLLFSVIVGDRRFYDHSNGIVRSSTRLHRACVPMHLLDSVGEYTVCYRKIIERKPYFPSSEEEVSVSYPFRPITGDRPINIYHLSDTHGHLTHTKEAGEFFGDSLDLLVLNGDIPDHSGNIENFDLIYSLCDALTGGQIPTVFSRGNHDMRGFFAEKLCEYTPTDNGRSYFTFRLGPVWGAVIDCGEDKPDTCEEYGYTICCHEFRLEQTDFLRKIIENADSEYLASGVKYRMVISHNPFTYVQQHPFDIEQELYAEWAGYVKMIGADFCLCGHLHRTAVGDEGGALDSLGQSCPVIVGSNPIYGEKGLSGFVGCAVTLDGEEIGVKFTNEKKETIYEKILKTRGKKNTD